MKLAINKVREDHYRTLGKKHETGRTTKRGIWLQSHCLFRYEENLEGDDFHLFHVTGDSIVYDKNPHRGHTNFNLPLVVKKSDFDMDFYSGPTVDNCWEIIKSMPETGTSCSYLTSSGWQTSYLNHHPLIEIYKEQQPCYSVYGYRDELLGDKVRFPQKDESTAIVLARTFAREFGTTLSEVREGNTFVFNSTLIDHNDLKVNLTVDDEKLKDFERELEELVKKYDIGYGGHEARVEPRWGRSKKLVLETASIETAFMNRDKNIDDMVEEKKGAITGVKYGL